MELPKVSIITPTYNKKNFFKLAIYNFINIDYPSDKLEWIIIDEGPNPVKDLLPNDDRIKYYYFDKELVDNLYHKFIDNYKEKRKEYNYQKSKNNKLKKYKLYLEHKNHFKGNRLPLGMKRNLAVKYASNDIILHMDDDDYYPSSHVRVRVQALLESTKKCVGCSDIGCFHINKCISFVYKPSQKYSDAKKISVATLAYTKKFWEEHKFENQDWINEGEKFLRKRKCYVLNWNKIIVALFHSKNDRDIKAFDGEPNGWHFQSLTDEQFLFITELDK